MDGCKMAGKHWSCLTETFIFNILMPHDIDATQSALMWTIQTEEVSGCMKGLMTAVGLRCKLSRVPGGKMPKTYVSKDSWK